MAESVVEGPAEVKKVEGVQGNEVKDVVSANEAESDMPAALQTEGSMQTAPFDPRFPNTNQTRYCYQSYLDFHRCQKVKGASFAPCNYFKKMYEALCPHAWVEKWDDQVDSGNFPGTV